MKQYYLRARVYSPVRGRFLSADRFPGYHNVPASAHKYLYGHGNPIRNIDPSGNMTLGEFATSFSINAVLARMAVGSVIGGVDAYLKGQSYGRGMVTGAVGGAVAPLIPLKLGIAMAVGGILHSISEGHYAAAFFEVATAGSSWLFATKGFSSYADFKAVMGSPGPGRSWHHIVEQNGPNASAFPGTQLHHPNNIAGIDNGLHSRISGFYSSKQPDITGPGYSRVRDWLRTKDFDEQYAFGIWSMSRLAPRVNPLSANELAIGSPWAWDDAIIEPFE